MKNYTFYHLLDYELPQAIDGASRQLTDAKQCLLSGSHGQTSGKAAMSACMKNSERSSSIEEVYPIAQSRSFVTSGNRVQKVRAVRDSLAELSLAYAISNYAPFAKIAERLIENEILEYGLFAGDDWSEEFSLDQMSGDVCEMRTLVVEIVLGLELLRDSGKVKKKQLVKLKSVLVRRLRFLEKKSVSRLAVVEQFAWLLERLVIALYLDDQEAVEKTGYLVESKYFGLFTQLLSRESRFQPSEVLYGIDCFFALCYWLDKAAVGCDRFVDRAFDQLHRLMSCGGIDELQRGAWVPAQQNSFANAILRKTSLLLILGDGLGRPDLIDCWLEGENEPEGYRSPTSAVITRPLMWFGMEEWEYRPFSHHSSQLRSVTDR